MERSANSKNVDNFSMLSRYYDELLLTDESFSLWMNYIEEEVFNSVLELASGSGMLAGVLKRRGYEVLASDISLEMKRAAKNNYDGEYSILNMTDYNLNKKFDLIICICDSINYLETAELDSFIECAHKHLNENGRLIFDMHSMARLKEFKDEYIEEGFINETAYQWTIMADEYDNLIMQHFTFYTKDGMIQEHHTQNVFEVEDVLGKMRKHFNTRIIEDFVEDEKVLVIGKKI